MVEAKDHHPPPPSSPPPKKSSTTTTLLTLSPTTFTRATKAPFLRHAGLGQIPLPIVSQWLSQDRLYAQGYVPFIGGLLSKIDLSKDPPSSTEPNPSTEPFMPTIPTVSTLTANVGLQHRVADVLIDALNNIQRELAFFEDVARRYGLDLEVAQPAGMKGVREGEGEGSRANETTRGYLDLFREVTAPGRTLFEGMVLLWATEKCYLTAWTYAKSFTNSEDNRGDFTSNADGGALLGAFVPNWTSPEFQDFVRVLAEVVDAFEDVGPEVWQRVEEIWKRVLDLEEKFWPDVEDEREGEDPDGRRAAT